MDPTTARSGPRLETLKIAKLPFRLRSPNGLNLAQSSSVLSPKGKDQVGDEREQSACRRTVPRSSTISPNDPEHEDAEEKS
ncbi:hypothetical protein H5410_004968 [Solanum commersonii]|uniref:Uncharacterized protein n=1 Tax=Solanum commersonii TaxID=4109 RepID=A0A9J6A556_SOLCO|nr:hypothetical protein H5410_004968 [Solanum commersonii]